jgi:transcription termination/antitermination protein NusG
LSLAILNTHFETQPSSGDGVRGESSFWFAVQTKPRHEKKVNLDLREKGIHSFLPLHREKRQWSDRQQWIELPLFSHYVFVHVPTTVESRTRVLQTRGVVQFVGAPGRGTPIPDEQIESVQAIAEQRIPMTPHEFLRVGTRVRIRGGALNGIEGVLVDKNNRSLIVSVDLIQKSVAIRIDGFEVEPV